MLRLNLGKKTSSLHHAVSDGDRNAVEQALLKGGSKAISERNKDGLTPLHIAAKLNGVGISKLLIENGADLEATDEGGVTPLHLASIYGNLEAIQLFVRQGADVLTVDREGKKASDLICTGVHDKRRRHAICGLLSLAEMKAAQGEECVETEGQDALDSMLSRRLTLLDPAADSAASEIQSQMTASEVSGCAPASATDTIPQSPPYDILGASEGLVDIYNGATFLNDDVRQSAYHLRLGEPLPGRHNLDIPYINFWGD